PGKSVHFSILCYDVAGTASCPSAKFRTNRTARLSFFTATTPVRPRRAGTDKRGFMSTLIEVVKRQPPGRIIAMGFAIVILLGSGLLMLPCSVREGVDLRYIDAL